MLDDVDGAIKFVAMLPTGEARDTFRLRVIENLGEVGAYNSVPKLIATYEGKLELRIYHEPYRRVLWQGISRGHIAGAAEWISTWPDPEARCEGYGGAGDSSASMTSADAFRARQSPLQNSDGLHCAFNAARCEEIVN